MNVLVVHAHHEPHSFSSALKDRAVATLTDLGHSVDVRDLYGLGFDPVSDRRNFTTVADPVHLKQQREETHASDRNGFAPDLEREMDAVLRADLVIFNFPLWWFGMPAILKGWVDRTFAYGRMYGNGKLYENGIGRGKRALVAMTTGGESGAYGDRGYNPPIATILAPINHGIFGFNGYAALPPFVAYAVARRTDAERVRELDRFGEYLRTIDDRAPYGIAPLSDFDPETGRDRYGRFLVDIDSADGCDRARIARLERAGVIVANWTTAANELHPATRLVVRARDRAAAFAIVESLTFGDTRPRIREVASSSVA